MDTEDLSQVLKIELKKKIRKIVEKAEIKGKFNKDDILDIKKYMKNNKKFHLPFSYCEVCFEITKDLFEEPLTSKRMIAGKLLCNNCKHHYFLQIGKGRIIDEQMRRDVHELKFGGEVVYGNGEIVDD